MPPSPPTGADAFMHDTPTIRLQKETELECQPYFVDLSKLPANQRAHLKQTGLLSDEDDEESNDGLCLVTEKHRKYLSQVWERPLRQAFVSLDASRPWMMYWCLHGCDLMDALPPDSAKRGMVRTLEACWSETIVEVEPRGDDSMMDLSEEAASASGAKKYKGGGFGGGPSQMAHAATTYAAVLTLCIIATSGEEDDTEESEEDEDDDAQSSSQLAFALLERIRKPLYAWFRSIQQPNGGYRMHHDGEIDVRASYTVLCCAKLLNLLQPPSVLACDEVVQFVARCQTYEGGLGGEPWTEAHGGYAFCGVAALKLIDKLNDDVLDMDALRGWLARRQMSYEGGFAGRSNKLVDGCYSFWQGGAIAIVSGTGANPGDADPWLSDAPPTFLMMDASMLERYILLCAQDLEGGLRDKPSKTRDFYHSCYNLSGLSVAQHYTDGSDTKYSHEEFGRVRRTHPLYNLRVERVAQVLDHFGKL